MYPGKRPSRCLYATPNELDYNILQDKCHNCCIFRVIIATTTPAVPSALALSSSTTTLFSRPYNSTHNSFPHPTFPKYLQTNISAYPSLPLSLLFFFSLFFPDHLNPLFFYVSLAILIESLGCGSFPWRQEMEKGHGHGVKLVCDFADGDVLVTQTTVSYRRSRLGTRYWQLCANQPMSQWAKAEL